MTDRYLYCADIAGLIRALRLAEKRLGSDAPVEMADGEPIVVVFDHDGSGACVITDRYEDHESPLDVGIEDEGWSLVDG